MTARERGLNYYLRNRERIKAERRAYYKLHREVKREYERRYYWAHREERRDLNRKRGRDYYRTHRQERLRKTRNNVLKRRFGITLNQYEVMVADRKGCCDICGGTKTGRGGLHVDHCHSTGRVRGLLCSRCNQALGLFRDSTATMLSAINYLCPEVSNAAVLGHIDADHR